MIKKSTKILVLMAVMLTVLTVVMLALFASGAPENSGKEQKKQKIAAENNNTNISEKVTISPQEAQEIAEKFVKESGAQLGIPKLIEIEGQMVYSVPIMINGTNVGEITINAITGKNMGCAGGVSYGSP
ncbi:MAG: PepSY domain-containing protein [Methanobacterium sp.]|nr:PepSY domain-containing protein [Methanobacterium sp.]